jgi:hypothetical protein
LHARVYVFDAIAKLVDSRAQQREALPHFPLRRPPA